MADSAATLAGRAGRPAVSVIVPFRGAEREATELRDALLGLRMHDQDELIVVANMVDPPIVDMPVAARVLRAPDHASSYYARNVGAEQARSEWLVFLDADCVPSPDLLDSYFHPFPSSECAALAGEIEGLGDSFLARWASSRGLLRQAVNLAHPYRPSAVTANVLVRATAWRSIGGFMEGIRSGGDGDFAWRLQEAGWTLEYRPEAIVEHRHRERLGPFVRQLSRHAAGAAWLNRRYPGSSPRPRLARGLGRAAAGIIAWTITGRFERAAFKAVDAVAALASGGGYLRGNAAPGRGSERGRGEVVIFADSFPRLSETFVLNEALALRRQGVRLRVEALSRPSRPARGATRGLPVSYREDDSLGRRVLDGLWLVTRHPLRAIGDARSQARWRRDGDHVTRLPSIALPARRITRSRDKHLHAHFATSAALEAMRLGRILRLPYSVAPHAFEIFARPTNLVEKLSGAKFVSTDCAYNVDELRKLLPPAVAARLNEVVLGIDESRFTRTRPLPGTRVVGAVGRLVEKKGFAHLVEAVGLLESRGHPVDALWLAGDGPLRAELEALALDAGIAHRVRFLGSLEPDEVLAMLHDIDLFVLPCVIAPDGDRDSMPVVVKEAMALELMVVGSDLVGLPEMIHRDWGRLAPPGDVRALANAIDELLGTSLARRAEMGARARAFVLEHCNVDREAKKVVRLIREDGIPQGSEITVTLDRHASA